MRLLPGVLVAAILCVLSACAYVHPDKNVDTDYDGMAKGPGLFTGRTGAWTVIGK